VQVCEASSAVALPLRVVLTTTVALPRLKRPEGSRLIDRPDRRGNCRLTSGWDVPSSWCRRSKTRQRASPARLGTVRPRRMRQPKSGRVGVLPAGARLPRWSRTNVIGRPLGLRVPARTQSPRHRGACCWPLISDMARQVPVWGASSSESPAFRTHQGRRGTGSRSSKRAFLTLTPDRLLHPAASRTLLWLRGLLHEACCFVHAAASRAPRCLAQPDQPLVRTESRHSSSSRPGRT